MESHHVLQENEIIRTFSYCHTRRVSLHCSFLKYKPNFKLKIRTEPQLMLLLLKLVFNNQMNSFSEIWEELLFKADIFVQYI